VKNWFQSLGFRIQLVPVHIGSDGGGGGGGGVPVTSPNQPLVMMAAPSARQGKTYTDLDAPSTNRVVLDYGDI
jgi:hypothetical protein